MIIRDNASPRGRIEVDVQRTSFLDAVPASVQPLRPISWANSRDWLFPPKPTRVYAPAVRIRVLIACTVCQAAFLAVNLTMAHYCGATCRQRAARARRKGEA